VRVCRADRKAGVGKDHVALSCVESASGKARTVFLFQTVCTPMDLLRALLTGLGVQETRGSLVEMQLRLKEILAEQFRLGKRVVVVIDEAQNLDDSVLELVRMLSNFETSREKLIQIILSGQPQLAEKIGSPELVQLRQRVSMFARLQPFSLEETVLYIEHRLRTAGYGFEAPLFTTGALALIAQYSEGIPRNINNLCFNSLSLGCALKRKTIDADIVREVVADLDLDRWRKKSSLCSRAGGERFARGPGISFYCKRTLPAAGWIPKLAVVIVVLLILAGVLFSRRWTASKAAVQTNSANPAPAPAAPSTFSADQGSQPSAPAEAAVQADSLVPPPAAEAPSSSADQGPRPVAPASEILVTPNRTLLGICVQSFGKMQSGAFARDS